MTSVSKGMAMVSKEEQQQSSVNLALSTSSGPSGVHRADSGVSAPGAEGSAPEVAYSTDEENYNFDTLADAVESMDDPQPGHVVYEGDVVKRSASHYWSGLQWMLEAMNEQAYDEAGEFAEDWPGNGITDEGEKALEVGIKALLDQHIRTTFYTVANVRRVELTAEMIAEFRAEPPASGAFPTDAPTVSPARQGAEPNGQGDK